MKIPGENPGKTPPPNPDRLSRWKPWLLRLLALIVAPLLVLALIELALRVDGYGYPTAFLLPSVNQGHATLVQNNQFGWRFFGKRKARAPYPISILRAKPRDTIRIIVFGESAAFGFPQTEFGLPRVLQATLRLRHPGVDFEVVNAAIPAINSHVILPIARDCAGAAGDIWVLYMGNNEVAGPFGAGAASGGPELPLWLIRASLALKTTRLGQLLDSTTQAWRKPLADTSDWDGAVTSSGREMPADDPGLKSVYQNFARNLADIIRLGQDNGVGVIVSTVAVNLKDCAPFASQHRPNFSSADEQRWDNSIKLGEEAQKEGRVSDALTQFQAAERLDASNAELQFLLGRCLLASGDLTGARQALIAARDLDTEHLRCDSRLNELIRSSATGRAAQRILLADAEQAAAAASPDGLPGWNLFYEHVHLTFQGNWVVARNLAEQIEKLLPMNVKASTAAWPDAADCARRLGRSDRDSLPGLTEMLGLLNNPPYTQQLNHKEQMAYLTQEARAARKAGSSGELQTVRAALAASPRDPILYERLAALQQSAGRYAEAGVLLRHAVDLLPSSENAWSRLGLVCAEQNKYEDAADAFQRAYDLNPQDVWALHDLAMAMEKLNRPDEAMRDLRRAVAITPRFGPAWLSLGQLFENTRQEDEAADCYQKAFQNRIPRASDLAALARFCLSRQWLEAAATNYDDAIKLDPANNSLALEAGQSHLAFGRELGQAGQSARAVSEFEEAVRLMPNVIEARVDLGVALYRNTQWGDSLQQFKQAAASHPTNATVQHYLTLLHEKLDPVPVP